MTTGPLEILDLAEWSPAAASVGHAADSLESGKVLFFPRLRFTLGAMQNEQLAPLRILEQRLHMPLA
jgi:hypothetical protein